MTISKNNAQTCIVDNFEKRPVSCPVLRWGETGTQELQLLGSLNILALYFLAQ